MYMSRQVKWILSVLLVSVIVLLAFGLGRSSNTAEEARRAYEEYLAAHPYMNREPMSLKALKSLPKYERPDLAAELDFLLTMDPALGRPAPERLAPIYQEISAIQKQVRASANARMGDLNSPWEERGPYDVGGRTRTLMFDPNDPTHRKVWAGSISGGIWYNNDITSANSEWQRVNDYMDNLAISSLAHDPLNTAVFYAGTGEGWLAASAPNLPDRLMVRGGGIWRTADGGASWYRLPDTDSPDFQYVQKVGVPGSGIVLAATRTGLWRSAFYGEGWKKILEGPFADVEVGTNGVVYAAKGMDGVAGVIYKSTDGGESFVDITPDDQKGKKTRRIELAVAPSNPNIVYAAAVNDTDDVVWFKKLIDGQKGWKDVTISSKEDDCWGRGKTFAAAQGWYNLILAVHPTDPDRVLAGGLNLHQTRDGGQSWQTISKWDGCLKKVKHVHADQHAIVFRPNYPDEVIFGNDGGVYYAANAGAFGDPASLVVDKRNARYNVTQFYACAIDPRAGKNYFLAGAQDNGTQAFDGPGMVTTSEAYDGDGGYCFIDIDQDDETITIVSGIVDDGTEFYVKVGQKSKKVNAYMAFYMEPVAYHDALDIIYFYSKSEKYIYRVDINSSEVLEFEKVKQVSEATHMCVSPYTENSTTLFLGTMAGSIFKITNANSSADVTQLNTSDLPEGSISCIEIGSNEQELLVTFYNYGITSVWYTADGGETWVSKEGNLPDMPVRWALFNPLNREEVLLATEAGVASTVNFSATDPEWGFSISTLAKVRVNMLRLRPSDNTVIAATFGRGLWSGSFCPKYINLTNSHATGTSHFTATHTITSTSEIEGGKVFYRAGKKVRLDPGFKVQEGSHFLAEETSDFKTCENSVTSSAGIFGSRWAAAETPSLFGLEEIDEQTASNLVVKAYPNPLQELLTMEFRVAEPNTQVKGAIYTLNGEKVATVLNGERQVGDHQVVFPVDNLVAGLYLYKLQIGSEIKTGKIRKE